MSLSIDIGQIRGSSSGSRDTVILSAKSPLITISEDSNEPDNAKFLEVLVMSEGFDDDSDFESSPSKRGGTSQNSSGSRSKAQTRCDQHCKFQTMWAAKLL